MASSAADVSVQLQVRSLHPALGAEVRGIDMRAPLDPATFRAVHDVWMQHLVLVFPGQHITDAEHVEFTRSFGEPEIFHQKIIRSRSSGTPTAAIAPIHALVLCCMAWRPAAPAVRLSSPTCTPYMKRCPTHSSARCKGARRSTISAICTHWPR